MSSRYSRNDRDSKSGRDRSRSRSPQRRDYDRGEYNKEKDYNYKKKDNDYKKYDGYKKEDEENHKKTEIDYPKPLEQSLKDKKPTSFGLASKSKLKGTSIQMKIGGNSSKPKLSVASAFNDDSDEEPEQMPPEARMRMKNIGRNTPTSSGPNSFGKTKQGFSDGKKVFERNLREAMEAARADD